MEKILGLDGQGIQKTLRAKNYLGDAMAMFTLNGMSGLVGMLTYFYTDKVGMGAAAAGSIMLIVKIVDAVTDLFMGYVVDRTKSRFGKGRPWLLRMAIPAAVATVLLFTIPASASASAKFAYGITTNILYTAVIYTAIAIPYGCMMPFITRSTEERSTMGIMRALFGYIIGMVIAIGLIPITNALGGDQAAWIMAGVIFGIVIGIGALIAFFANKERYSGGQGADGEPEEGQIPFVKSIGLLFQNKYWVIMLAVMLVVNIVYGLTGATGVYYAKWVLGDENLVALLGAAGLVPVVVGFAITGPMIKKFGLAKTARIALLIGVAATVVRVFFPYDLVVTLVFGALTSFATIPMMSVGGVLVNNTVEYGEWKTGKRLVGMTNSANGFGAKIGSGLGGALVGWILALGSYDGTLTTQPASAITSVIAVTIWLPGILLLGMYLLLRLYDLDKRYPQIVKELDERKQKADVQG